MSIWWDRIRFVFLWKIMVLWIKHYWENCSGGLGLRKQGFEGGR